MTDALRYQQLTVVGAVVYNSYGARVYSEERHASVKRREQNLIVRIGKPEAKVTNNRKLRSTYWNWLPTDKKHRAASLRQQGYLSTEVTVTRGLSKVTYCYLNQSWNWVKNLTRDPTQPGSNWPDEPTQPTVPGWIETRNLAIANRSCVSCAHNTSRAYLRDLEI